MQFLKSLFCLLGFDNRTRFFAICVAVYAVFIMLASTFTNQLVVSLILLVLFISVIALACLRRLHDAKLNKNWLFVPSITFTAVALVIIISEQHNSYSLLIIPALCTAVLLTYPSAEQRNFILGYYGPVNMQEYQQEVHLGKEAKFRVEPTLIGANHINTEALPNGEGQSAFHMHAAEKSNYSGNDTTNKRQVDIGEIIRIKLLSNSKTRWLSAAFIMLTFIGVVTSWLVTYINSTKIILDEAQPSEQTGTTELKFTRKQPLAMPDNYTLYLSDHQGITLNWQADEVSNSLLWSQETAQGDDSCKEISFNKGEPIRSLLVQVANTTGTNTDYYASFSPLDSKNLIQALAFRGNFTLCGYEFSLKGSQAALATNEQYARWLDY